MGLFSIKPESVERIEQQVAAFGNPNDGSGYWVGNTLYLTSIESPMFTPYITGTDVLFTLNKNVKTEDKVFFAGLFGRIALTETVDNEQFVTVDLEANGRPKIDKRVGALSDFRFSRYYPTAPEFGEPIYEMPIDWARHIAAQAIYDIAHNRPDDNVAGAAQLFDTYFTGHEAMLERAFPRTPEEK